MWLSASQDARVVVRRLEGRLVRLRNKNCRKFTVLCLSLEDTLLFAICVWGAGGVRRGCRRREGGKVKDTARGATEIHIPLPPEVVKTRVGGDLRERAYVYPV